NGRDTSKLKSASGTRLDLNHCRSWEIIPPTPNLPKRRIDNKITKSDDHVRIHEAGEPGGRWVADGNRIIRLTPFKSLDMQAGFEHDCIGASHAVKNIPYCQCAKNAAINHRTEALTIPPVLVRFDSLP